MEPSSKARGNTALQLRYSFTARNARLPSSHHRRDHELYEDHSYWSKHFLTATATSLLFLSLTLSDSLYPITPITNPYGATPNVPLTPHRTSALRIAVLNEPQLQFELIIFIGIRISDTRRGRANSSSTMPHGWSGMKRGRVSRAGISFQSFSARTFLMASLLA